MVYMVYDRVLDNYVDGLVDKKERKR